VQNESKLWEQADTSSVARNAKMKPKESVSQAFSPKPPGHP